MLDDEIDTGSTKEQSLMLRFFLCRALGEFETPEGLAVLVKAAGTQRSEEESEVRLAALQAIAVLAENVGRVHPGESLATPEVEQVLLEASSDADPRIRKTAAVPMGVVGGEKLTARLAAMLADSNPDVRYNAATAAGGAGRCPGSAGAGGNARSGRIGRRRFGKNRGDAAVQAGDDRRQCPAAVEQLLAKNPMPISRRCGSQLERLLASNPDKVQKVQAAELLKKLPPAAS